MGKWSLKNSEYRVVGNDKRLMTKLRIDINFY